MHSVETFRPWARDAIMELRAKGFKFTPANWFARDLEKENLCGGCLLFGLGVVKSGLRMLDYKLQLCEQIKRGFHEAIAEMLDITSSQALDLMESFDREREKHETRAQFEASFQAFIGASRESGRDTSWYELGWELRKQALL